ncbi:MAG: extracellular solute-binding protein, partial [Lachnospiraceae bacterium]|nr:extracellular solute-binding protein [Lachnospiraceae bacterium]
MKKLNKVLATVLAASMVISLAACGDKKPAADNGQTAQNTPAASGNKTETKATSTPTPTPTLAPLKISVLLPSDDEHTEENKFYDQMVAEINKYTNMDITWKWADTTTYYTDENLGLKLATGDVEDVLVVGNNAAFYQAAEEGLFWDLAPYLDDYDNLATIPEAYRAAASKNGKLYGLPRGREIGRNGMGYRLDWLENLGLEEPTNWEAYHEMLYQFTYGDPDGNGIDDTVGLGIDSWPGVWDIMLPWFGVPNIWGIDSNGNLINRYMTEEYKSALKKIRQLYEEGLINNGSNGIADFRDLGGGSAQKSLLRTQQAGSGVQVVDDQRKVQEYFQKEGLTTEDKIMYTVRGYVDCGYGACVQPYIGISNMIAVSKVNIKTEAQLRQVLQFLNDINDGEMLLLIDSGLRGVTWDLDENGYVKLYTGDEATEKLEGLSGTYRNGFNQIPVYFTADANPRPYVVAPATSAIKVLEQEVYADNRLHLVPNYGLSYESSTPSASNADTFTNLGKIMSDAQQAYIVGEIDDAGLEAAINQWAKAGGTQLT